jgi:hypothetical protein
MFQPLKPGYLQPTPHEYSRSFLVSFLVILPFRRRISTFTNFLRLSTTLESSQATPSPSRRSQISKSNKRRLAKREWFASCSKISSNLSPQRFLSQGMHSRLRERLDEQVGAQEFRKIQPPTRRRGGATYSRF